MDRHIPRAGEKYIHFKQKPYQILCVAKHSETQEKMVVYQALYGTFDCYTRPLEMFMSEVDYKKYPKATQQYRFELVEEITESIQMDKDTGHIKVSEERAEPLTVGANNSDASEEQANPTLLQFLDADTLEQKYQIIKSMGDSITDRLVDDFAVVLDLVIPEGDLDFRYQQLLSSVRTMQKYETKRLRKW